MVVVVVTDVAGVATAVTTVSLIGGFSFFPSSCGADDIGRVSTGTDIAVTKLTLGVEIVSAVFETSIGSLFGTFATSIKLILTASDGTFKTEVVVAVLNVTEVFVHRFADGDDETITFGSFFLFDFPSSVATVLFLALSTSSFDSSPRKALSIICNFDLRSRFLLPLNSVEVFVFGLTNDTE